jgi:hypothetical protein
VKHLRFNDVLANGFAVGKFSNLKWEEAHKFDGLDLRFLQNKISFYFELFY